MTAKLDAKSRRGLIPARIGEAIRREIFSGRLQPGDPLREMHLARHYGVSQACIREALTKLEHAGLVRRYPRKGSFVTHLSPQELMQRLRLRVLLEGLAASDAARRLTKRHIEELRNRLKSMAAAVPEEDYFRAAQADLEFHRYIWRLAGDNTLYKVLDQLAAPLFAFNAMYESMSHRELKHIVLSHEPIVAALQTQEETKIKDAIKVHIDMYREYLFSQGYQLTPLFIGTYE